jgi:RHS repeat-associated protein
MLLFANKSGGTMFVINVRKETVLSTLLIVVILFNALSPTLAFAETLDKQPSTTDVIENNNISSSLTLGAQKINTNEQVPIFSEQIALQAQKNQEEKAVRFKAKAEPAIYTPGTPITLSWSIQNLKPSELDNAEVVIHTPTGVTSADPKTTYTPDGLASFALRGKKDVSTWNVAEGTELPIYFGLDLLVNDDLVASKTVMVDQARFSVDKNKGGKLNGLNGKVELDVPASAINESLDFDIREPAPDTQPGVSLTWQPLEIIAVGKESRKNVDKFKNPIKIKVKYDETQIFDWDENALTLYYYDQDLLDWFPMETTVDTKNKTLTAYSNHLTVFDYKANNWQSQSLPTVDSFKVSDFTGAGTYAVNLWTPPGPNGLQPSLALTYNSQVIDESSAFSQPSWVGMGWSLDTGGITRNMHGTDSNTSDDTFAISAGGVSGLLLPVSVNGNITTYNTADQSFMKVELNTTTGIWTATSKDGTKYTFGKAGDGQLDGISMLSPSNGCTNLTIAWRWSLTNITDVHGNQINYDYYDERKSGCTAEVAVYPTTISYGNYSIVFNRGDRNDYQTSWTVDTSRALYGTKRLNQVLVQNNGVTIRRYDLTYASDTENTNIIYPNFKWSHNNAKTLTLIGIQEFDNANNRLPATTFTYGDNMHVTKVDNGQGGQVQMTYQQWAYFDDVNKDLRSLRTWFGSNAIAGSSECYSGYPNISWTKASGYSGTVACNTSKYRMQVGNTPNWGVAEHVIPEHMVKPGARYRYYVQGKGIDVARSIEWGLYDSSTQTTASLPATSLGTSDTSVEDSITMPVTFNPSTTKVRLGCRNCYIHDVEFILFPQEYYVTNRTVTAQPTGTVSSYAYDYDLEAANNSDNSAAVASNASTALYTNPLREFRGHAMSQTVNPEGLATVNWFYQTDILKGRSYDSLVLKRDYFETFNYDSGTTIPSGSWVPVGGTHTYNSGAAVSYNSASDWSVSLSRNTASLISGEVAVAVVRLSNDANAQGEVGLVNGGTLFGVTMQGNTATASNGATLLSSGSFIKNEWYAVMLFLDAANGSRIRMWQLDNPANSGETVIGGVGGGNWTFRDRVYNGTISLSSYFEGTPYSETITRYNSAVQYDTTSNNGIPDLPSLTSFKDLQIAWNTVISTEQRNYNGDARYAGTKQEFTYDTAANYGHLLTQKEYAGDNGTWTLYRGSKTEYAAPNTTAYIVSLPGRQVTLDCTSGTCDFTGYNGKIAESYSFYDGSTNYTTAPVKGDLTRQRTWVKNADYTQTDFTYYANGNLKDQIAYTGYATSTANPTSGTTQTTTTEYNDGGYNTYPTKVTNTLGQFTQTSYDYNKGVPLSVTDPNGVTTSAVYDGFARITSITAPGDLSPTLQVAYYDTRIPFQIDLNQRVDGTASIQLSRFYDGAGRQIQTQTVNAIVNGAPQNVVVDSQYNAVGRLEKQGVPRVITNGAAVYSTPPGLTSSNSTVTTYDILGRTLSVTQPNTNQVQYSYADLSTTITDPKGNSTTSTADVWGHTLRVNPPTEPVIGYVYDVSGQLRKTIRGTSTEVSNCLANPTTGCPNSKTVSIGYDSAGRKLDMTDPDMGHWVYEYDAIGNLVKQTDNRLCQISLGYDALNRLLTKTSNGAGCINQVSTSYFYDNDNPSTGTYDPPTSGNTQIGRRTAMLDNSGSTSWNYDTRGRVLNEVKTINGAASSYTTSWAYNSADLPISMTYPDNEILTYHYNSDGALNTVTSSLGNSTYVGGTKYDKFGRIISMDYGNSVLQKTFTYFPMGTVDQGGLLNTVVTTRSDQTAIQNLTYSYDKNANVNTIVDALAGPQTQTFTYDSLNRIKSADVNDGTNGLYNETYDYDANTGNLSLKAGVNYTYSASHPHAVASLSNANTYGYDANGNMTDRNVGTQAFDLAYDAENRLVSVSAAGSQARVNPTNIRSRQALHPMQQSGFPSTPVLDNFNRADSSAIGPNWNGVVSGYSIASNKLDVDAAADNIHWQGIKFDADQEAYFTFTNVDTAGGEQDLILKSQSSNTWASGVLELLYNVSAGQVEIWTYHPTLDGWKQRCISTPITVTFANGDQFGARARANGDVEVYKNGAIQGTCNVSSVWEFYDDPGYIGLWFIGASSALLDDFGGGNVSTIPTPTMTASPTSTFTATSTSTPSNTPTGTNTPTFTPTATFTPSSTPTKTNTPTVTYTPSNTPTNTATSTPTFTPTRTNTPTNTFTPTVTYTPSNTPTRTNTPTNTATPTKTNTPTVTFTPTKTNTPTITPTFTATPTSTSTPTSTPTATATNPSAPTPPPASVFASAAFSYDGDGKRVKADMTTDLGTTTTYFIGAHYEVVVTGTGTQINKYYYAGSQRIAMRTGGTLYFMIGDHLGSTSLMTYENGNVLSETRYKAWGEERYSSAYAPTKYSYTGQYSYTADFGLMFYNARWYDSSLGRFAQADTIVPGGVQGLDRYAYANNDPVKFKDSTGHDPTHNACDYYGTGCSSSSVSSYKYFIPPAYVVAGIKIQSPFVYPWETKRSKNTDQFTNLGPAKISDAVMKAPYGTDVYDKGNPRGTGIGLAGRDQLDPSTANWAMKLRIQVVTDNCKRCSSTDTFIMAALAQNGWDKLSSDDALLPKYKISPTTENGPTIDWAKYFASGSGPRWNWDHGHQLDLFVTEVQAQKQEGWYVPDVDWVYINNLK